MSSTGLYPMLGLRMIRKQRGYSQLKVAMDLSISREALSYYENGQRSPDVQMLLRLSDYFHVSIDYLIRGKEYDVMWEKE
ncbi:MAG: helix-turn-helix transcriptional regulator [Firmicutes bacterium]|nr:helix-turn-helix transcriptional regulator [Bacillota bacterium]